MIKCQNCGNTNTETSNFCRFCGTKFLVQQPTPSDPYNYVPPRPYAWKTDEFQTQNEVRRTMDAERTAPINQQVQTVQLGNSPQMLMHNQPAHLSQPYRCPHCMSQFLPRLERRVSTTGWITFAVLLVFFFPLFCSQNFATEKSDLIPS